jgi:hypothetical protein
LACEAGRRSKLMGDFLAAAQAALAEQPAGAPAVAARP